MQAVSHGVLAHLPQGDPGETRGFPEREVPLLKPGEALGLFDFTQADTEHIVQRITYGSSCFASSSGTAMVTVGIAFSMSRLRQTPQDLGTEMGMHHIQVKRVVAHWDIAQPYGTRTPHIPLLRHRPYKPIDAHR